MKIELIPNYAILPSNFHIIYILIDVKNSIQIYKQFTKNLHTNNINFTCKRTCNSTNSRIFILIFHVFFYGIYKQIENTYNLYVKVTYNIHINSL